MVDGVSNVGTHIEQVLAPSSPATRCHCNVLTPVVHNFGLMWLQNSKGRNAIKKADQLNLTSASSDQGSLPHLGLRAVL